MKLCRCTFLVPLCYNDGREVEPEFFIEMKTALDRQFGGFTVLGQREGSWHGQVEQILGIEVYVPVERIKELRTVVRAIGHRLGQKQMALDIPPPSTELIDIDEDAETNEVDHDD